MTCPFCGALSGKSSTRDPCVLLVQQLNQVVFGKGGGKEMGMPMHTSIQRVVDGAEPQSFKSKFDDWQKINLDKPDFDNLVLGKGIFSGSNIAKGIKTDPQDGVRHEVARNVQESNEGDVTLRRTTIDEIEIHPSDKESS